MWSGKLSWRIKKKNDLGEAKDSVGEKQELEEGRHGERCRHALKHARPLFVLAVTNLIHLPTKSSQEDRVDPDKRPESQGLNGRPCHDCSGASWPGHTPERP